MDADRLPSFDRYELDLANERLLHDGEVVLLTLDADLPHTVPSRYETEPLTERNAPQYRLEEACSALGVKTLKNILASYRHAARGRRGEGATRPLPHQAHVLLAHRVVGATSTGRQVGEADG